MAHFSTPRLLIFLGTAVALFVLGRATAPHPSPALVTHTPEAVHPTPLPAGVSTSHPALQREPLTEKAVDEWKHRLGTQLPSAARDEELLSMLGAWAQVNPRAALEYAQKNLTYDRQAQALAAVFTGWAKKDPTAAWNWVTSNGSPSQNLRSVLTEIGKNDPALAQRFASEFAQQHPEQATDVYFCVLESVMHNGNFEQGIALVNQANTRDTEQKAMLINLLAGQWARYQPDKAAAWVLNLPAGPVRDQALDALGQAWSDRDPLGAANFAVTLPAGVVRQTALKQAISKWTLDDPAQASRWMLKFDAHEDFDQAVASIATSHGLMYQNLNLALNWAGSILDENLRTQTTGTIVSNWYATDPAGALNYVKTSPDLNARMRETLLKLFPSSPQPPPPQKGS